MKSQNLRRAGLLLSAGVIALAFTALPVQFDPAGKLFDTASAYAGNGNGKGNGNGNGNAGGSAKSQDAQSNNGSIHSALGSLNAAHASSTALANANPNSQVGKIAAYKDAAIAAQGAAQTVDDANAALADAEAALDAADLNDDGTLDQAEKDAFTAAAQDAYNSALGVADTDLDGDVDDQDVSTQEQKDAFAQAAADLADAQTTVDGLEPAVDQAQQDVADAEAAAEDAQNVADGALVNAANKDITDENGDVLSDIRDAVNDMLGI